MLINGREPRVLVACPTLGLNPDPDIWLNSLIRILNGFRRENFTHAVFCPYKQLWWQANNLIWDCAFSEKFDYILRIDDDIHGVPDDAVSMLLNANKDVIGAAYCNQRYPYTVNAMVRSADDTFANIYKGSTKAYVQSVQWHGYEGTGVEHVELIGFGMTLIKVAPFKFLERPMYKGEEDCPDDSYFAQVCLDNKIEQFVHWGVRLKHRHVTFQNAGHLYNADTLEMHPEINKENNESVLLADANKPTEVANA